MELYWNKMTQMKFHLIYLGMHYHRTVVIERRINIFLAVVSTGSLAGIFISPIAQKIWACILVFVQVLTAAKPYLPFSKRIQELDKGIAALEIIYEDCEKQWVDVHERKLTENEASIAIYNYEKKWKSVDASILKEDSLPRNEKLISRADDEKNRYFRNVFGGSYEQANEHK